MSDLSSLTALSPLDGRYRDKIQPLAPYFSESALIRYRIRFEVSYLLFLSNTTLIPTISAKAKTALHKRSASLTERDDLRVKEIEKKLNHDVKAIEYFVGELLDEFKIDAKAYIHIGLTSDDVNETAYALMMRDARDNIMLPALRELIDSLCSMADQYKTTPMLARTHGQPAIPTTVGKELIVFAMRLHRQYVTLRAHIFASKLSGAVGNYSAQQLAFPKHSWMKLSEKFLHSVGLSAHQFSTQILPPESYLEFFHHLQLTNSILIDFTQDMWRYISDEYFTLTPKKGEVGSSTMPQKVNPIDFENSEGNAGIANALFTHFAEKLPISRLQRDLSGSTVTRNIGVAFGHSLLGYSSCLRGLKKVTPNIVKMEQDLLNHWEILTEGMQTLLRTTGDESAYAQLHTLSRGKKITKAILHTWIATLSIDPRIKKKMLALSPINYLGLAEKIVTNGVHSIIEGGV